jgi:pyrroline-5-carboxylate reductase
MKYGFIGLGNMASAILRGMVKSGRFENDVIYGFNRSREKTLRLAEDCGLSPLASALEVAEVSDVVILAVKPQMLADVLPAIAPALDARKLVLTIAAGKDIAFYEAALGTDIPLIRVMPNINAKVGASATALCPNAAAQSQHLQLARNVFETVGSVFVLSEAQFAPFSALSGCSVAFVYLYIDALARAGVQAGFSRPVAQDIAAQAVLGSARLVQESGEHPMALVDQVCSPAGTTIEGIFTLQRLGFEDAVHQAVGAIMQKDEKIRKG